MSAARSELDVLDQEFLAIRAKLLELAAALDRLDRAEGGVEGDPRVMRIREALAALGAGEANRAEKVQLLFSLPYDKQWRDRLGIRKFQP